MSQELIAENGDRAIVSASGSGVSVTVGETETIVTLAPVGGPEGRIDSDRGSRRYFAYRHGDAVDVWLEGEVFRIRRTSPASHGESRSPATTGEVTASMPGMVVRVLAAEGDAVEEGDGIVVLESMKMQLTLSAPRSGTVRGLAAVQGTMVEQGSVLARIEAKV